MQGTLPLCPSLLIESSVPTTRSGQVQLENLFFNKENYEKQKKTLFTASSVISAAPFKWPTIQ